MENLFELMMTEKYSLNIKAVSEDINFDWSEDDVLRIELSHNLEEGPTLHVTEKEGEIFVTVIYEDGINYVGIESELDVFLPTKVEICKLKAKTVSGGIECDIDLDVDKVNFKTVSGDIDFGKLSGNIKAKTVSGDIEVESFTGKSELETVSGDIEIEDFTPEGLNKIQTVSGDATFSFREGLIFSLLANTLSGDIDVQYEFAGKSTENKVIISTTSGDVRIKGL